MSKKNKILIGALVFFVIIVIVILAYTTFYFYKQSQVKIQDENHFFVEVEQDDTVEKMTEKWIKGYIEQYMVKYVPYKLSITDYEITSITKRDEDYVQVEFNLKTKAKNPKSLASMFIATTDGNRSIECQLVLKPEVIENLNLSENICFVTYMVRPATYDVMIYNQSGQADYDQEYYNFMNRKKYEDANKECTYKIEDGKLYFTYDYSNTWIEVPQDIYNDILDDGDYKLDDQLYSINKDITYISGKNNIYITTDEAKNFQKINFNEQGDIKFVYAPSDSEIYVVVGADYAMGRYAPIIYLTEDGGESWNSINDYNNLGWLSYGSFFNVLNKNAIFLIDPNADGSYANIMVSDDTMRTFENLVLPDGTFKNDADNGVLNFKDIYDTPEEVENDNGTYKLIVGQGSDGDYNGNDKVLYESNDDGKTWYFVEEFKPEPEVWEG